MWRSPPFPCPHCPQGVLDSLAHNASVKCERMRSQKLRRRPDTCHAFHPEVPRAAGRHGGRAHGWVAPRACLYPKCTDVSSCTLAWAVSGAHPAGWTQTRPVNPEGDPSRRTVTLVPPGKGLSWDITGSGASTHTHPPCEEPRRQVASWLTGGCYGQQESNQSLPSLLVTFPVGHRHCSLFQR